MRTEHISLFKGCRQEVGLEDGECHLDFDKELNQARTGVQPQGQQNEEHLHYQESPEIEFEKGYDAEKPQQMHLVHISYR